MDIQIYETTEEMSVKTAAKVAVIIRENPGRLVCFAAGDTPIGMLRELIRLQEKGECDLSAMYYAGLDEWVGLDYNQKGSYIQVMNDLFYTPAGIPRSHINIFDGVAHNIKEECSKMDSWINAHGGIFLAVLGVGLNGHIGFNEPFGPDKQGCFVIALDETTKRVSEKYFGERLPVSFGITIGWRTLFQSQHLFVIAAGSHKSAIIEKAFSGETCAAVPASLLQTHTNLIVALDKEASGRLSSVLSRI
jgi:glucosamine-6-phosphate isomerase